MTCIELPIRERIIWLKETIISLNLFDSDSDDPTIINRERQTTRLYIFLLIFILIIIIVNINFIKSLHFYIIPISTQADYARLHMKYSDTLQCPCSKIQFSYEKMVSINIKHHQICSTAFVSPIFIAQLFDFNATSIYKGDFMKFSGIHFTHIQLLCVLSHLAITKVYDEVKASFYTSRNLITESSFLEETKILYESFKFKMQGILNRLAEDIDELMTINYAISAGYMPSNLLIRQSEDVEIELGGFSNCSCLINAKTCSTEGGFYQYNPFNESTTLLYSVMGIRMACSPQKSTIMSSLACWYSSKCLNTVINRKITRKYSL